MAPERKYERGDKVKVISRKEEICGIEIYLEGFIGTVIKERPEIDSVDILGDERHPGHRTIRSKYVMPLVESEGGIIEYNGEFYIIACIDCGNNRCIKPQHIHQVKRCINCQNEHNRKKARDRAKRRRR